MSLRFRLALLAVLAFCVTSSVGLRCWECSSDRNHNCGDPFNYTHFPLVDCDLKAGQTNAYLQGLAVCRKTRQRVNGIIVVDRTCAWEQSHQGPCSLQSANYAIMEHCSICRTEGCNGGTTSAPTLITTIFTPFFYFITKFA